MGILPAIAHLTLNGMDSWQNSQKQHYRVEMEKKLYKECWNGERLVSNWYQFMNENMYQVDGINTFCLMVVICWRKETYDKTLGLFIPNAKISCIFSYFDGIYSFSDNFF